MDENINHKTNDVIPEDIRMVILSDNTKQKISNLVNKYGFLAGQAGNLEIETNLVMTGLEHPSKFIGNLARTLGVPEEKARMIAEDINVEIFRPVRESLRKIHNISEPPIPPLPIRVDSNRGSSILQDKIGTKPTIPRQNPPPSLPSIPIPPALPKPPQPPPVVPKPPVPPAPPPKQEIASIATPASLAFQKKELPSPATDKTESAPKPDLMFPQLGVGETENSDENEDNLSREEILADIENPVPTLDRTASLAAKASLASRKDEEPPKPNYQDDPYREPLK